MAGKDDVNGDPGGFQRWLGGSDSRLRTGRYRRETWRKKGAWKVWSSVLLLVAAVVGSACGTSSSQGTVPSQGTSGQGAAKPGAPVEIGLPYPGNLAGLGAIFGGNLGPSGGAIPSNSQTQAFYQSIVDYVNSHGGILGHQITPVFYAINAATASGSAPDQAQCTAFTQDHHVLAVMAQTAHSNTLTSCMQAGNAITFDPAGSTPLGDPGFASYPLYAMAGGLSLTRLAAVEANGLYKDGFFGAGAKVAVVGDNGAAFTQAIDQVLKPALAKHGVSLSDEQLISSTQGAAGYGAALQAMQSAVLRFKGEGINHVIFFDNSGDTLSPWVAAETSQQYFPRLGFTSNELPGDRSYLGNKFDQNQIQQYSSALAVGWNVTADLFAPPVNATGALCNSIMEGGGASAKQAAFFWGICDQLLDFAAAANAGGQLTPVAVLKGLAKAKNLPSAELVGPPSYANGRRDGAAVGKFLGFNNSCQCFQYTSGPFPLSSLESY